MVTSRRRLRSTIAAVICVWIYQYVFALTYGTVEQKTKMVSTLCRVDKSYLQAFMVLVPYDIACLYLVNTAMTQGVAIVYKWVHSEVERSILQAWYLIWRLRTARYLIFIPADKVSEAEKILKDSISKDEPFNYNSAKELVVLNHEAHTALRNVMQTIAYKYNGSMALQAAEHLHQIAQLKYSHEIHALKLKGAVAAEKANTKLLEQQLTHHSDKLADEKEKCNLQLQLVKADLNAKDKIIDDLASEVKGMKATITRLKLEIRAKDERIADLICEADRSGKSTKRS